MESEKQHIVNIDLYGYGDDSTHTICTLTGTAEPNAVFDSFHSNKITSRSGSYLSAYKHEKDTANLLVRHFKRNGYFEVTTHNYEVGD